MAERAFHDPADHHEVPKLVPSTEGICERIGRARLPPSLMGQGLLVRWLMPGEKEKI